MRSRKKYFSATRFDVDRLYLAGKYPTNMKILITDDHSVLRKGLSSILSNLSGNLEIDEANNGKEALSRLKGKDYDLIFLDISLPDINGLELLQRIAAKPGENRAAIISLHSEEQFALRAFKLGAVGYINKNASHEELSLALSKLLSGQRYIPPELAERILFDDNGEADPHEKLSEREFQVMIQLAKGQSLTEIAEMLCIVPKTVSTYRARIMGKMGFSNNAALTIYAMEQGLIT